MRERERETERNRKRERESDRVHAYIHRFLFGKGRVYRFSSWPNMVWTTLLSNRFFQEPIVHASLYNELALSVEERR